MKKFLLIALIAFGINAKAQITLEHTYDSASTIDGNAQLMIINFEVSGERYVNINRIGKYISIYDMNHALLKNISLAGIPLDSINSSLYPKVGDILYLSEKLFNTDSKMEFMYLWGYNDKNGSTHYLTHVYNEEGLLVFSDTSFPAVHPNYEMQQWPIYNTSHGTKMILSNSNIKAKVFSLPGTLSLGIQEANQSLMNLSNLVSNPYPNPTNNSTRIDYTFPDGVSEGEIVFYDLQGKELKSFRVDRTFDHLLLSTSDLPAGTYCFQLQTSGQNSAGKKMVVIR